MSEYDKMSVHELVQVVADIDTPLLRKKANIDELPVLEAAIRKAVVREAAMETAKKPKKRVRKKTVGGTGMTADEFYHWQHDSYPN